MGDELCMENGRRWVLENLEEKVTIEGTEMQGYEAPCSGVPRRRAASPMPVASYVTPASCIRLPKEFDTGAEVMV
ncbi:hypothetical protein QJS10_CPB22g00314 [Acorus calamus]|uniref:Uncharacterized protein n=1 Tax=Acorus calamus TaxID=4465 RepID=A0AAV9C1Y0_ACOCL|nr:hypothetical protein QJS10_CPB22g00314 [Acorus calamus]